MEKMECKNSHFFVNFSRIVNVKKEEDVLMQLERFLSTDNAGVIPDGKISMPVEDKRALAVMEGSVKLVDGHYQLALPWGEPAPKLPNDQIMAERRLELSKKRFLLDLELFEKYRATVGDCIIKGYAKRVLEDELIVDDKLLWYLLYHPVFNPNKPGKTISGLRLCCEV